MAHCSINTQMPFPAMHRCNHPKEEDWKKKVELYTYVQVCWWIARILLSSHLALWKTGELSLGAKAGGGGGELGGFSAGLLLVDTLELLADTLDTSSAWSRDGGSVSLLWS